MEKRSDLRNTDCFPPALDTALVTPFSAWCRPFPFPLQRLYIRASVLLLFPCLLSQWKLLISVTWEASFSPSCWAPGRCVPAGTLLLFAVALALQVPFTVPLSGCSEFPVKNKEDKVIPHPVLKAWIPLWDARWLIRWAPICFMFK